MPIGLLYLVLLVLAFFLLVVLPQRRQLAAHRALVNSLKVGDEIITTGGIHGTIRGVDETILHVEVADGVELRLARGAVASRVGPRPDEITAEEAEGRVDPGEGG
ncbi:MAG: preprotein translocase subunit YajC [Actinobacteria bacterium]|nr:preprotein translocase subunit YajC [Actinomycetota bacterium]